MIVIFAVFNLACFCDKKRQEGVKKQQQCKFYSWEVFVTFLINFVLILLVILMSIVLWNLLPQIKKHVKYSKCSIFNSLDTVLYGDIQQDWVGFSPLYKQYQSINKSNMLIAGSQKNSQTILESLSQIIQQLSANKQISDAQEATLKIDIPKNSQIKKDEQNVKIMEIVQQLKKNIKFTKQKQIAQNKAVEKIRTNFSELAILRPIRQKLENIRLNIYQLDVYNYKAFHASTVKRLQKFYFCIIVVSLLLLIGFLGAGAFQKFQFVKFMKIGYFLYWVVFFGLVYVSACNFFYWSFTYVSCSASNTIFKNQKNFLTLGKPYEPFYSFDICLFKEGNFTQNSLKYNSVNEITQILSSTADNTQSKIALNNLIQEWINSIQSISQEKQQISALYLKQKLVQMLKLAQNFQSFSQDLRNIRENLHNIEEMKHHTDCRVFKKQVKFMQTTVCDNLTVLQFNNFIFGMILMIILLVCLIISPISIKMIDQMKESKIKNTSSSPEKDQREYLTVEKNDFQMHQTQGQT